MREREKFEAWWGQFIVEHDEWKYADTGALLLNSFKAGAESMQAEIDMLEELTDRSGCQISDQAQELSNAHACIVQMEEALRWCDKEFGLARNSRVQAALASSSTLPTERIKEAGVKVQEGVAELTRKLSEANEAVEKAHEVLDKLMAYEPAQALIDVLAKEREKCAVECDVNYSAHGSYFAGKIRSLK